MRIATTFFALAAVLLVGVSSVSAQPSVAVYFDDINTESAVCPGPMLDTLYVVAQNFNNFLGAIEYQIDYSPGQAYLTWIGDDVLNGGGAVVGSSPTGISIGYPLPANGFFPLIVQRAFVFWNCSSCGPQDVVKVNANPFTVDPTPVAVIFNTQTKVPGIGLTSLICAAVGTEDGTWGKVKALYSE